MLIIINSSIASDRDMFQVSSYGVELKIRKGIIKSASNLGYESNMKLDCAFPQTAPCVAG